MRLYVSLLGCATCAFAYNNVAISRLSSVRRSSASHHERSNTALQLGTPGGGRGKRKLPGGKNQQRPRGANPGRGGKARDGDAAAARAKANGVKKKKASSKLTVNKKDNTSNSSSSNNSSSNSSSSSMSVPNNVNMISLSTAVQQTAAAAVGLLADTDAARALLSPLQGWLASKRRVAEAVASEKASAAAAKAEQQRQLSEDAWKSLLQENTPKPITDTYNALASAAAAPGKLAKSVGQTAEEIAAAPAKIKKFSDEAVVAGGATVETLASLPRRAQEAVEAVEGLGVRAGQAFADGVGVYEWWRARAERLPKESKRLVDAVKVKLAETSEAAEVLPSRQVFFVADVRSTCSGELPTRILHEDIPLMTYTPCDQHARSKYHVQRANMSFDGRSRSCGVRR